MQKMCRMRANSLCMRDNTCLSCTTSCCFTSPADKCVCTLVYTHRFCTCNRGVTERVGEPDDRVALVRVIPAPVSHRDLQGYVLLGWSDDGNVSVPEETIRPCVSHRRGSDSFNLLTLLLPPTWPAAGKHPHRFLFFWSRTCTAAPGCSGKLCLGRSPCL